MTVRQNLWLTVPAPREARERELVRLVEALALEVITVADPTSTAVALRQARSNLNRIGVQLHALSKVYDDPAQ